MFNIRKLATVFQSIDLKDILTEKVILLATPPVKFIFENLYTHYIKDLLILTKTGDVEPRRRSHYVTQRFRQMSDIRKNNCQVAILHGRSIFAITDKSKFAQFEYLLLPIYAGIIPLLIGLLRYGRRHMLHLSGVAKFEFGSKQFTYLVIRPDVKIQNKRRQFGPTGLSALEILQKISDLNQVVLRWHDKIEGGRHIGDIDVLISADQADLISERFSNVVSTHPIDVYTDDGSAGCNYKNVAYFMPDMAKKIILSGKLSNNGVRISTPHWQLIGFIYHLMFHNKSEKIIPGTILLSKSTFSKPYYYEELIRLAELCGVGTIATFDEMEKILKDNECFPSIDLIGFYSRGNPFLKKRYFDQVKPKPGLATFFIRDFGQGLSPLNSIRKTLKEHFEILDEGPVTPDIHKAVLRGTRGGNWADRLAPGGVAEPIYWFTCWDNAPKKPNYFRRRKFPNLDNEHLKIKDIIRKAFAGNHEKIVPLIHSSDNTLEAIDHIRHLHLNTQSNTIQKIIQINISVIL